MGGRNFISQVFCLATSPPMRHLRERSGESGYMPRNLSELKSGGTIPMLSPMLKSGGTRPPVPHRSTPVLEPINNINTRL